MLKIRDFDLEVKAGADGVFYGYGSVFGNVDRANEIVAAGAFTSSLAERAAKGRTLPVLWQHRTDSPIGVYDVVREDQKGLRVEGRLLVKDVALAAEAHALMRAGAVSGLSIGYWTRESNYDEKTGIRTLTRLDLEEISIVTTPANDEARIDAVKMKLAYGSLPTLSEFEAFLRDAGMPRSKAAAIASRGLKPLLSESAEDMANDGLGTLVDALKGFSLPSI
jgi:uncharacterized protein